MTEDEKRAKRFADFREGRMKKSREVIARAQKNEKKEEPKLNRVPRLPSPKYTKSS